MHVHNEIVKGVNKNKHKYLLIITFSRSQNFASLNSPMHTLQSFTNSRISYKNSQNKSSELIQLAQPRVQNLPLANMTVRIQIA